MVEKDVGDAEEEPDREVVTSVDTRGLGDDVVDKLRVVEEDIVGGGCIKVAEGRGGVDADIEIEVKGGIKTVESENGDDGDIDVTRDI
jgi:hypothetical protein